MCTRFFSWLKCSIYGGICDHLYSYLWSENEQRYRNDALDDHEHKMLTEKRTFAWRLDDFPEVKDTPKKIHSEKLQLVAGATIGMTAEWELSVQLHPHPPSNTRKLWFESELKCTKKPTDCDALYANYEFRIRQNDAIELYTYKNGVKDYMKTDSTSITVTRRGNGFWSNGRHLMLEIEITFYAPALCPFQILERFKPKFVTNLQEDLTKAFDRPVGRCEAPTKIVVTQAKKEFLVSRGVLSARSPVFEKMFETDMEESKTGIIRVTDINLKTMKVLLQFLYTGTLLSEWYNDDVIVQLVYAAGKYQLPVLLEFLDHIAGGVCTTETAGRLLNLARKLEMKKAEREVFEFMQKRLTNFDEFADFYYDSTAIDVL